MRNVQTVPITLRIPAIAQQRLHEMAKAAGYSASVYAQLIFDAAFAARVGHERGDEPSDAELDSQVRAVFVLAGQFDTDAICKAIGISEPLALRILDAWRSEARQAGAPMSTGAGRKPAYLPEMVETIRTMWAEGLPTSAIAKAVGKETGAVSMFASKNRDICPSRAKVPA